MCGRYASSRSRDDLVDLYEAVVPAAGERQLPPSWNVAPTDPVYAVAERRNDGRIERRLRAVQWGLVPSFAKDPSVGTRMINARAETLTSKPAYRRAAAVRRALVVADGWFEWRPLVDRPGKQPYYMTPIAGAPLAFAGIWEYWRGRDGTDLRTCAIVTTAAVGPLAYIHDRMPLVLPPNRWSAWLDLERDDPTDLLDLDETVIEDLELRPVSRAIGNVKNNSPALIERIPAETLINPNTGRSVPLRAT